MIHTPRLILRPWLDSDLDALTAINDDPASIKRQQGFQRVGQVEPQASPDKPRCR